MFRRVTTKVLVLLSVMYCITYIDRVNVSTAAAQFGPAFGLSHTQIGFVFSAFAYPYLVIQIFGGWLGDRFGPRRTLTVCAIVWAGATILTGFATGMASMVFARLLLGLGEGATFPTATRAMSNWMVPERRGFAQGITHAASRIGNAVAPPLVAWLMVATSWRSSFFVVGAISMIWAIVWAVYFRDNPREHGRISSEEADVLPEYSGNASRLPVPWIKLLRRMLPVTIVYFCYGWVLWMFLTWIPQYFQQSHHMQLGKSAAFSAGVFFAGVIGDWLGGEVTDWLLKRTGKPRVARNWMVAICMMLTFVSLLPILLIQDISVPLAAVALSCGFFFNEMTIGPMWAVPMDIAPQYAGTASGIMNMGSAGAAIVSPVIGGFIIDRTGNWSLPFVVLMGVMLIGTVLTFVMRPERRIEVEPESAPKVQARYG